MADSPDPELKSSHLYIFKLVFLFSLPSLNMGSFLSRFYFGFSFLLALRFLWFSYVWPHLELRASWQFDFPCRPPLGLYSRLTTKVRAAPPPVGGCPDILFVVCHWFLALHNLTASSHQFSFLRVYFSLTHVTIDTWREGCNWDGTGSPGFNGSTATCRIKEKNKTYVPIWSPLELWAVMAILFSLSPPPIDFNRALPLRSGLTPTPSSIMPVVCHNPVRMSRLNGHVSQLFSSVLTFWQTWLTHLPPAPTPFVSY